MRAEDLHVIVLSRALQGIGGLERHVHDLINHLLKRDIQVTLVTRQPPTGELQTEALLQHERLTVRLVPYHTFPGAGRRGTTVIDRSSAYPLFGWRAGRLAHRLVRQGGVQLVHGHGAAALGYAIARRAEWLDTVPFIFNPHGLEEFGSTGPGLSLLKHVGYAPLRAAVRRCARAADRVVSTDRALVPILLKHLDVTESRISVVPNAIDLEDVDRLTDAAAARGVRERLGLASEDVLLVSVGRLEENKGFHYLLAALAKLTGSNSNEALGSRWRYVLLGEGPYRAALERQAASSGLGDSVLMPGRVSETDLHAWFEAATLFVHPTLYEGSSLVTLEAMAHRRAIVGTRAGGLPDKVSPGVNGWLVPACDSAALANVIREALGDRDRLRTMGERSRVAVEREFAWTAVIGRLLDLYDEVLTGRQRTPASNVT